MSEITARLVKELRERTGAGMMDCKSALVESRGDLEEAADWLRKKGLSAAAKKSGRVAAEGLIGIAVGGNAGAIAEVNSETDFVARNEQFQKFVRTVTELALAHDGDLDTVLATGYPGTDRTVAEELTHNIATIGENMTIRRTASIAVENGCIAQYVHNSPASGLGKIGVIVALESNAPADKLEELGTHIAQHVAATNPQSLEVDDLDKALVEHERTVLADQARESGKPENIIEKMIEGRLRKFYEEVVLLQQAFVRDQDKTISDLLKEASEEVGAPVKIKGFLRFELGEGVEKKSEEDFAEEVKRVAGG